MHLPSFLYDRSLPILDYHRLLCGWYKMMRAECPVVYDEDHQVWLLFRHKDGVHVRDNYATFSSVSNIMETNFPSITNSDPPLHTKMRAFYTQALSTRSIAALEPAIVAITAGLVKRVLPAEKMDWVADLAHPLPLQVVAYMLGLPRDDWPRYRALADTAINRREGTMQAAMDIHHLFAQAIEEHQRHPRQDFLSAAIAAEVDGEHLSFIDLIGFCQTIFMAGYINTANSLASIMLCFVKHPEALTQLRQHPELMPRAIEEILRYMPPLRGIPANIKLVEGRVAATDTCIGGQFIRKGERVKPDHFSVNFDEEVFTNPECFDITRSPNRHLVFAHGIHYCMGAPLARLEMKAALGAVLEHLPEMQLALDGPPHQYDSDVIFGPERLPFVFTSS